MVGIAIPLIWRVFDWDSKQLTIRPILGIYWQMVRWRTARQNGHFLLLRKMGQQLENNWLTLSQPFFSTFAYYLAWDSVSLMFNYVSLLHQIKHQKVFKNFVHYRQAKGSS